MARADLEAAAEGKYPRPRFPINPVLESLGEARELLRAAYIQGRLDQAEADARIAESGLFDGDDPRSSDEVAYNTGRLEAAAAIRKGVQ